MGITYNHSNYESKRYTSNRASSRQLSDFKSLNYNALHCSSCLYGPKRTQPSPLRNNPVAMITNYCF
jgi:hypothetical protein